jgi:hypothetical protein
MSIEEIRTGCVINGVILPTNLTTKKSIPYGDASYNEVTYKCSKENLRISLLICQERLFESWHIDLAGE